jgi:glycosyltransferase involved in cell wall biosynthesis
MQHGIPDVRSIARTIRKQEADLVHTNNSLRSAKPAILAARMAGIPCVCHVRGFEKLYHIDRALARHVDLFVYISRAVAQAYVAQGIPANKGIVVHNIIDLNDFGYDPAQAPMIAQEVRSEFGWGNGSQLVGLFGRIDWWKGHDTFLQAMSQATEQLPHLKGLIVGAPVESSYCEQYYKKLKVMTRSLGLENNVVFAGFRSDVPRLMSATDVIVLSSSTPEPFGRVVIEGMAAGKPVVATAAGGVLDIIQDGTNGRLVPIQNPDRMSEVIVELISNPQQAERIGRAARECVEQRFTLPLQIATLQKVYNTILATPKRDRAHILWHQIVRTCDQSGDHRYDHSERQPAHHNPTPSSTGGVKGNVYNE